MFYREGGRREMIMTQMTMGMFADLYLSYFIYKSVYNIKYIQYIHLLITYLQIKSLSAVALSPLSVFVPLH